MKKTIILFACAAAALVFASCQKETREIGTPDDQTSDLKVITAAASDTKTITQDGVHVLWESGDSIALFAVQSSADRGRSAIYSTSIATPSQSATFTRLNEIAPIANEETYYAFYPASALNKWASSMATASNRRVYVDIPQTQNAVVGGWDKKAAILASESKTASFQFRHIVSYVKFTVDGSSTPFVKLTISAKNGGYLTGENIGVRYESTGVVYDPSYTSGTYNPTAIIKKSDDSAFGPGTYYVAVLPGSFTDGFAFTFENAAGKSCIKSSPANIVLEAGDVASIGTVGSLVYEDIAPFEPSVYTEGGVKKGVIFWRDPYDRTKGKAVSAEVGNLKWHASVATFSDAASFDTDDSKANRDYILAKDDYTAANYPAVAFCQSLGSDWRLPSKNEFDDLVRAWSGHEGALTDDMVYTTEEQASQAAFDALLDECIDGAKMAVAATSWYWTGQANKNNGNKIRRTRVVSKYFASAANATNACYVRCIRDVTLQ